MSLSTQPYKGTRDFYPEDMRRQKWMFAKLRQVAERFGYEEYNAPLLEPLELYAAKTGDEIVNEQTYQFEDRGGRKVAIRPEMTPSVSRMVAARRQESAYPLRLYNIGNRLRYERPQKGRLREFWQIDVDIFGVDGIQAEAEVITAADQILKSFGATNEMYEIKVNSRKTMNELLLNKGFSEGQIPQLISLFDRIGKPEFDKLIFGFSEADRQKILDFVENTDSSEILKTKSGLQLAKLIEILKQVDIKVTPSITINRGFDYYTDIVFEVFDTNPENNRSMFGGGRYSGLIGLFGVEPVEAVGFAMGDVTLLNFLESNDLLKPLRPETDIYVVLVGDVFEAAQLVLADLRGMGVNVAVDATGRKIDKQIKSAAKKGIRYAMFIGEQELESKQFKIKDLVEGQEEIHSLERVVSIVKDYRSN